MRALFDADILVFRCGFAAERKEWHLHVPSQDYVGVFELKREAKDKLDELLPGVYSRKEGEDYKLFPEVNLEPLSHALQNVKTLVARALEAVDCTDFDVEMFLSGPSQENFRYEVAKTRPYKGNRDRDHRPTYEKEIREFIAKTWPTTISEGEEADDLLGIMQTKYGPEESVIISLDKDLDQIPGLKYNFLHDVRYNVTPEQAMYNFHLQLMTGDTTDNIPGLPGIGPGKGAKALHGLETEEEQLAEVMRMYQIHSGKEDWREYLIEQARLIWIRRYPDQMWEVPEWYEDEQFEWDAAHLTLEVQ